MTLEGRLYNIKEKSCPYDTASMFSRWTLSWIIPLLRCGQKIVLSVADLWVPPKSMRVEILFSEFVRRRATERKHGKSFFRGPSKSQSLIATLLSCHFRSLGLLLLLRIIFVLVDLFKPVVLGWMLDSLVSRNTDARPQLLYALLLVSLFICHPLIHCFFWWQGNAVGLAAQTTAVVALYLRSLRTRLVDASKTSNAAILNLVALDARKFADGVPFFVAGILIPFHLLVAAYLLRTQIGDAGAAAGVVCLAALIPVNTFVGTRWKKMRHEVSALKNARTRALKEMLDGAKTIKINTWEAPFVEKVKKLRRNELSVVAAQMRWQSFGHFLFNAAPILIGALAFATSSAESISGTTLKPERAFVALALLNSVKFALWTLPYSISIVTQSYVAGQKMDDYLNDDDDVEEDEVRDNVESADFHDILSTDRRRVISNSSRGKEYNQKVITLINASFARRQGSAICLYSIDLHGTLGESIAIFGEVGAGKSTLLAALAGQLLIVNGLATMVGRIALVSQTPWIQNASIKENILFGFPYRKAYYDAVVEACALNRDFLSFPEGDQTEIGVGGAALSGGQKSRLALARAVYANHDVYLLDEPLAALDATVTKWVFEAVLSDKGLLGKKCRVLATSSTRFLSKLDKIVRLEGGVVKNTGSYDDLFGKDTLLPLDSINKKEWDDANETTLKDHENYRKNNKAFDEGLSFYQTSIRTYINYLGYFGWTNTAFQFLAFAGFRWLEFVANTRLSAETAKGSNRPVETSRDIYILTHYTRLAICSATCLIVAFTCHILGSIRASRQIHDEMTELLARMKLSFFDSTPTGRVLTRISTDVEIVDEKVPENLSTLYQTLFHIVAVFFLLIFNVSPLFCLFLFPLLLFLFLVRRFHAPASRGLRRLEAATRSPILSHFDETLRGLPEIRVFDRRREFLNEMIVRAETHFAASFLSSTADKWIGLVFEFLSALPVLFASLDVCFDASASPGDAALTVGYAMSVAHVLVETIRVLPQLEADLTAVDRMLQFRHLPAEATDAVAGISDGNWTAGGEVVFSNFSFSHRAKREAALKRVNLRVDAGARIGVVGRTGAGKSSLVAALLRLGEKTRGLLEIDGLDVEEVELRVLRSRIAVVPQDSVVFAGSLRWNLDPLRRADDDRLRELLADVGLGTLLEGGLDLDNAVSESGVNLSVGQRQLICVARALLRDAKLLVLDEAAAAVDEDIEARIRNLVFKEAGGRTVIVIDHRIHGVLDCDKVVVMEEGEIMEEDHPSILLTNPHSLFNALAKDNQVIK